MYKTWLFYRCLMTMHINLSSEMEAYIKSKVASGFYGNATEVIRDAIRRMQTAESHMAAWQSAIAKGETQLDRGEGVTYTPELLESITQVALDSMNNGKPINPDVVS
jgi:antitoxin ParD1/3/4